MGVQHVRVLKYPSRECVYAVKGSALVVPQTPPGRGRASPTPHGTPTASGAGSTAAGAGSGSTIQRHLQDMLGLIRPDDNLRMAVRLESAHPGRSRYLVVVASPSAEEYCLLGIDCQKTTTIGLVHRLLADTEISLDGDGGIVVRTAGDSHIFKPVSVQAMWSALQTLNRCRSVVPRPAGLQDWVSPYERLVTSEQSCLNEWNAMEDIESRRPPSPDSRRNCVPSEREETERMIRARLREIMLSVDLDQVTSKELRTRLEVETSCCLKSYKAFIDAEMLTIMGQMDHASCIFEHLFLGSEWNASDLEELKRNRIGHILNVTREIDNFFPGKFLYQNIRVYDEEATELLKHWDKTFKFIAKAKSEGSRVLVHCRMGVSRSAAVVIAYAMKAYGWNHETALKYVKQRRGCVKPNASFLRQLETYQGILDASKQRHNSLWRSKSETNLQSRLVSPVVPTGGEAANQSSVDAVDEGRPATPVLDAAAAAGRPKSWSPADNLADALLAEMQEGNAGRRGSRIDRPQRSRSRSQTLPGDAVPKVVTSVNVRVPCNGQDYRVSQNQAMNLSLPLEPIPNVNVGGALRPDPAPPAVYECVNKKLVPTAETWVGQVVEHRSGVCGTPLKRTSLPPGVSAGGGVDSSVGLVRRQAEDFERRSSSSEGGGGARGSCGSVELAPPSRQSSWSSLEGALLRAAGLQSPSRSSSWGSYDAAHTAAAADAESASLASAADAGSPVSAPDTGSPVQLRPPRLPPVASDEAAHSLPAVSRMSVQLRPPACAPRSLASSPHTVSLVNLPSAAGQCRPAASSVSLTDDVSQHEEEVPMTSTPGQVRRLAQRLEARSEVTTPQPPSLTPQPAARSASLDKLSTAAVPAADVAALDATPSPTDEVSVRSLVGRFEAAPRQFGTPLRSNVPPQHRHSAPPAAPARKASLDLSRLASFTRRNLNQVFGRHRTVSNPPEPVVRTAQKPPPPPVTARQPGPQRKRLHGKTHPLAKLDVRTRHVNSVFNTM